MSEGRPEGWYPDPFGDPARERYFDGASWSITSRLREEVRLHSPAGFSPSGRFAPDAPVSLQQWGPPTGEPARPPRRRRPWGAILAGLLSLLLLAGAVTAVVVLQPFRKIDPSASASPETAPSVAATPSPSASSAEAPSESSSAAPSVGPSPSGAPSVISSAAPSAVEPTGGAPAGPLEVSCGDGEEAQGEPVGTYASNGLAFDAPTDWPRLDVEEWRFLQQSQAWGDDEQGVALGGLPKDAGYPDPETALDSIERCLLDVGPFPGFSVDRREDRVTTVAGHPARERSFEVSDPVAAGDPVSVVVRVVDLGSERTLTALIGYWTSGDDAASNAVARVLASVRDA